MRIAKIDRICPISGNVEYSVLDEQSFSCGRRTVDHGILRNISADEAESRIAKKHKAELVSEEDFNEFLSLFREEDNERITRQSAINEERKEKEFYASLTGIRLKIYNDLNLESTEEWWKANEAINDEFRRRYHKGGGQHEGTPYDWGNGWQPLGG